MPFFRLDLSYDGSGFRGYAKQGGERTVQGELEAALARAIGASVKTAVAGRTDAGVHARGQVVSFQLETEIDTRRVMRSLNAFLGGEVVVRSISAVDGEFNARFSATSRTYRYLMSLAPVPDPLNRHYVWHVTTNVDTELVKATAAMFVGTHDFGSFCRSVPGKSSVRRVERSEWLDAETLEFWISANAFCHQMVRSLVGLCYDVGRGHIPFELVAPIMKRGHRSGVGPVGTVAPAHGLTLWEVRYS